MNISDCSLKMVLNLMKNIDLKQYSPLRGRILYTICYPWRSQQPCTLEPSDQACFIKLGQICPLPIQESLTEVACTPAPISHPAPRDILPTGIN